MPTRTRQYKVLLVIPPAPQHFILPLHRAEEAPSWGDVGTVLPAPL